MNDNNNEKNLENKNENETTKQTKKSNVYLKIIISLLVVIIILLLLRCCGTCDSGFVIDNKDNPVVTNKNDENIFDLNQDPNIEFGERETLSKEERRELLNKQVEDGMITISMNMNPVFETGTSSGNLLIVNETKNKHPQVVEIYRDDTNELIYKSGLIPVGARVDAGKLLKDLDKGEYPCKAHFNSIDENTGKLLGKALAEIKIIVQK